MTKPKEMGSVASMGMDAELGAKQSPPPPFSSCLLNTDYLLYIVIVNESVIFCNIGE
ncbi:MAG: hypothetical protein WB443_10230 [Nitrososphaeraceae archaeon]